ncbi:MAG: DUF269 domain-containing protein [Pleurocapsa sp.]|mgnify:CR=1 FL=1
MNQSLTLEKPQSSNKLQHPFLQELIEQLRNCDSYDKYCNWSDELLLEKLTVALKKQSISLQNLNLDPFYQLLTKAFYQAIGSNIERNTGHITETHVHVRNKEFSSAVIFCDGVLVLNSLISGYKVFKFFSIRELIETAENNIIEAVIKASYYLDF